MSTTTATVTTMNNTTTNKKSTKANTISQQQRQRPSFIQSLLHVVGIVLLRFQYIARIWGAYLIGINVFGLYFVGEHKEEPLVILGCLTLGVIYMAFIYQRYGFIRILGTGHLPFLPMLYWLINERLPIAAKAAVVVTASGAKEDANDSAAVLFYNWLYLVIVTNVFCVVLDVIDLVRYTILKEREPHYKWNVQNKNDKAA